MRIAAAMAALALFGPLVNASSASVPFTVVPLVNGDFSQPVVPRPKGWLDGVKAPGWTYSGDGIGGAGLMAESDGKVRPQYFYWNGADGAIRQVVDQQRFKIDAPGQTFRLSYEPGGNGQGSIQLAASILVGGSRATTKADALVNPRGTHALIATLLYVAKADDVGKTIGVEFAWTKPCQPQASLARVELTATEPGVDPTAGRDGSLGDVNIRYIGRWDRSNPSMVHSYWSGAYMRVRFTGTSIGIKLAEPTTLSVSIDGEPLRNVSAGVGVSALASRPLSSSSHLLYVGSAGQNEEVAFQGLVLEPGFVTQPVPDRLLIEFVGDSLTQGNYGYAWNCAEMLACDHVQIAYSGCALTSGYSLSNPQKIGMDVQYFQLKNFTHLTEPAKTPWNFTYTPRIIVVNLGSNEPWEAADGFAANYVKFIHQLRDRFPSVQIVCLCPFSGDQGAGVLLGATELMKTDKRVHLLDTQMWLSPDEFFDGRHPNMFGSLHAAQRLSDELRPLLAP